MYDNLKKKSYTLIKKLNSIGDYLKSLNTYNEVLTNIYDRLCRSDHLIEDLDLIEHQVNEIELNLYEHIKKSRNLEIMLFITQWYEQNKIDQKTFNTLKSHLLETLTTNSEILNFFIDNLRKMLNSNEIIKSNFNKNDWIQFQSLLEKFSD